jgi:Icc-related predicted phosphoesterase
MVGRRTVGRASNYAARKIRSSEWGRSETGRMFAGLADRGAKASFDVRGTSALKNFPLGSIDAGAAQKGGYKGRESELVKARTEYAKSLGQSEAEKKAAKDAGETKKKAKEEYDNRMKPLAEMDKKLLEEIKENINESKEELKIKRQKLEEARKSGNADQITKMETEYNNGLLAHKMFSESERKKIDSVRGQIKSEKTNYASIVAVQEEIIKKNDKSAVQKQYGNALQNKDKEGKDQPVLKFIRAPYDWTTAAGSARHEAAGKIIGEAGKAKTQKGLDELKEMFEKAAKKEESGGEEKKPKE